MHEVKGSEFILWKETNPDFWVLDIAVKSFAFKVVFLDSIF